MVAAGHVNGEFLSGAASTPFSSSLSLLISSVLCDVGVGAVVMGSGVVSGGPRR